ncbi:GNAT family N-acetyltransferase [Zophobihabitans entericus]|uniref:GNAT family N-acetyltransferase n=2 Tax=Zophobihabitans entericus TaxID=1635327 RepID=A0A6G9IDW5_9GAMM|nr:GNAT family N-acetyltransferase [Zophobihabitans entericus]
MITIRFAQPKDEATWCELWDGYCRFYQTQLAEEITQQTWQRILSPNSSLFCRMILVKNKPVGFALYVLHEGSWVTKPICYLEDLFVTPEHRGKGLGKALLDDLFTLSKQSDWSRIYWFTQKNNPARALYDQYATTDDFVRYQKNL